MLWSEGNQIQFPRTDVVSMDSTQRGDAMVV